MSDARLTELEMKFSHQEVLLEELHQVLYRQQATIDVLELKLGKLADRVRDEFGDGVGPASEKPPHY